MKWALIEPERTAQYCSGFARKLKYVDECS